MRHKSQHDFLSEDTVQWLLTGEPWIAYRTYLDLLDRDGKDPDAVRARTALFSDPFVLALVKDVAGWPGTVLNSHKSANQTFHKLAMLADMGLTFGDAPLSGLAGKITEHVSDEGPFCLPTVIPVHFGGTGKEDWAWALCDAPVILYALIRMGLAGDKRVLKAVRFLTGLLRDNGWPCAVSPKLGKFRGPGKKDDPCPYATLAMVKMLMALDDYQDGEEVKAGIDSLLRLWETSGKDHPYMFYMGTDFRKLKAPPIWYDILSVMDVLSRSPHALKDKRYISMVRVLDAKAGSDGRFTPESVYTVFKDRDFGQKKSPSRWVTFLALRILKRK